MRRRTFRQIKARTESSLHHHVYVVLLAPEASRSRELRRQNPQRDPKKPCVYVGMTGLSPDERFANHKSGVKAAGIVKKHGVRLLPELYEVFNPNAFRCCRRDGTGAGRRSPQAGICRRRRALNDLFEFTGEEMRHLACYFGNTCKSHAASNSTHATW